MAHKAVRTIAEAVSQDSAIDWASAESSAVDANDREVVRQLRLVASIGEAARRLAAKWGPFELREQIGQGSFGTVYRAWDRRLEKEVALKLLHSDLTANTEVIHEARLLSTVEHPNIIQVYGADVHGGRVGIWMKLIRGKTLKDILVEQGPFGAEEAAQIGRDLCRALAAVHQKGFVHRDIKAQNVMREVGGRYVLMDFGAGDTVEAVKGGDIKGSPAYLAPEVVAGESPTAQSDFYSLGVLLFFLVTGEFPVIASTPAALLAQHRARHRKLLRDIRPNLPAAFVRVVVRATDASPHERPETAGAMQAMLEDALEIDLGARGTRRERLHPEGWWTIATSGQTRRFMVLVALLIVLTVAISSGLVTRVSRTTAPTSPNERWAVSLQWTYTFRARASTVRSNAMMVLRPFRQMATSKFTNYGERVLKGGNDRMAEQCSARRADRISSRLCMTGFA